MMNSEQFEKNYTILNPEQREAVETLYGPIMVVAGPGTGKTQIIGLRTAYILQNTDIAPENILITTFTEAGVIAIKKRLLDFIGEEAYKVQVTTIHSFAEDVIKSFPEEFIEEKLGRVIDDIEAIGIYESILDEGEFEYLKSFGNPYFYLPTIKSRISQLKQEGISPEKFSETISDQRKQYDEELAALVDNKRIRDLEKRTAKDSETYDKHIGKLQELLQIYKEYLSKLSQREAYDFNDMINSVLEKFSKSEDMRYHYAEKYQFIMLDEFQDTNNAQNQIVDLILSECQDAPNLMVVGDDDQSIYRFQGANIENLLGFFTKYPETKVIVLKYNYRSIQPILDAATQVISHNNERITQRVDFIEKNLVSGRKDYEEYSESLPKLCYLTNDVEEKVFILKKIREQIDLGMSLSDIAIIMRSNREVKEWSEFLIGEDIPVESKLKSNILESEYVNLVVNILGFFGDPYFNDAKLIDILLTDLIDINNLDIFTINNALYRENYTKKFSIKLIDYLGNVDTLEELELHYIEKIIIFIEEYKKLLAQKALVSFPDFFQKIIESFGILEFVESNGNFDDLQDIFSLFSFLKKQVVSNKNYSITDFLYTLGLYKKHNQIISRQNTKKTADGIQLVTAHSSKGLEYSCVFIPGMNYGNWDGKKVIDIVKLPDSSSGDGLQYSGLTAKEITTLKKEKNREEDRRLFFVALTRAEKDLYITIPASKENKILLPSSFVEEIKKENRVEIFESNELLTEEEKNTGAELFLKKSLSGSKKIQQNYSDELLYIEKFLENYKLSPSDLNKFLEDPKVFLREAVFKYPFVDNVFTIFGKVYHRVLELFFLEFKKEGILPEKEFLTKRFEMLLKKEVLTFDEYCELLEKGTSGLSGYYDEYKNNFAEAIFLEYNFRYKNIYFQGVPLTGKIDKVELHSSISPLGETKTGEQMAFFKESVSLVDFKTGSTKTLGVIKGTDKFGNKKPGYEHGKYYRQLLFYKLLCEQDTEFSSLYGVEKLQLDFVEGKNECYKKLDVDFTGEDYDEFKLLVVSTWEQINDLIFWKNILES